MISIIAIDSDLWTAPILILLAVVIVTWPVGRRPGLVLLALVAFAAVLLPLFGYWFAGRTHPNAIAGLLPWNDAAGYYGCALSVLDGEGLHNFCQRRPAYSLYFAGLMRAAASELQLALVLQAIINGAAMFVVAHAAMRRWGAASGLVVIAALAPFAAVMSVATVTENLGFVLGAAGLVLVLSGAERRSSALLVGGVFVLSVALNARSGAFLVLPLLVLWPFLAEGMSLAGRWRLSGLLALGVAAGFVPGLALVPFLGGSVSEFQSNFSYTLYGLAAGGERWTYTLHVLSGATSDEIYRAAFALMREQPLLLLVGLFQGFLEYLQRLLTYVPWLPARVIVGVLWLWGLASVLRVRGGGDRLLALVAVGVALSSPILSIDGDTRVYAVTVAADGLLAALGFARFGESLRRSGDRPRAAIWVAAVLLVVTAPQVLAAGDPRFWGGAMVVGGILALIGQWMIAEPEQVTARPSSAPSWVLVCAVACFVFVVPWLVMGPRQPEIYAPVVACDAGEPVIARLGRDSPVITISDSLAQSYWPVVLTSQAFRAELEPLTHLSSELAALPAGTAVVFLYDRKPLPKTAVRSGILVGTPDLVPNDGRVYQLCVSTGSDAGLTDARRVLSLHPFAQ